MDATPSDLDILFPERRQTIAGVAVTMREISFAESMQHATPIAALCAAMGDIAIEAKLQDLDSLRIVFGAHADELMQIIATCCDQPLAWVQGLTATAGEQLLLLWWGVNADFFLQRVLLNLRLRAMRMLDARAGQTSSPPSSAPDTMPESSPGTPVAS